MSLLDFWKASPQNFEKKNIEQILNFAGDGKLRDVSQCSEELRQFLKEIDREYLKIYAEQCLEGNFKDSGFVLQDIVNEIGRRIGFEVEHGNYHGRKGHNNADGFWKGDDWTFVIEVKTTDAYSIKLDKIASWLESSHLSRQAGSCLIVVGRQDTATLEDQLRGSRHNRDMRIVGFNSLYEALELMEKSDDPNLRMKLIDLFKPKEFARIDQILSVAIDFSEDREKSIREEKEGSTENEEDENLETGAQKNKKHHTTDSDREGIEKFKKDIAKIIENEHDINLIRRRSSFESRPKGNRYVVSVSKLYKDQNQYWYSIHTRQINYLDGADNAFVVIGCLDSKKIFAIPKKDMDILVEKMNFTILERNEKRKFFHVILKREGESHYIHTPKAKGREKNCIDKFEIKRHREDRFPTRIN